MVVCFSFSFSFLSLYMRVFSYIYLLGYLERTGGKGRGIEAMAFGSCGISTLTNQEWIVEGEVTSSDQCMFEFFFTYQKRVWLPIHSCPDTMDVSISLQKCVQFFFFNWSNQYSMWLKPIFLLRKLLVLVTNHGFARFTISFTLYLS